MVSPSDYTPPQDRLDAVQEVFEERKWRHHGFSGVVAVVLVVWCGRGGGRVRVQTRCLVGMLPSLVSVDKCSQSGARESVTPRSSLGGGIFQQQIASFRVRIFKWFVVCVLAANGLCRGFGFACCCVVC